MSPQTSSDRFVILDRDGTLVIDRGYLDNPAGLEFMPDAPEALRLLTSFGYRLIVISNQSGIGRGLFSMCDLESMNLRLHEMVEDAGSSLAKIYCCPHTPEQGCDCRKPRLGLMLQAAGEFNFDPHQVVVIGDRDSDVEFAHRSGARAILISAECSSRNSYSHATAQTLLHAALLITSLGDEATKEGVPKASRRLQAI